MDTVLKIEIKSPTITIENNTISINANDRSLISFSLDKDVLEKIAKQIRREVITRNYIKAVSLAK